MLKIYVCRFIQFFLFENVIYELGNL